MGLERLSRGERIYLAVVVAVILAGLSWWGFSYDRRATAANDLLRQRPEIANYPYVFKVLSVENGVARVSTPRSAEAPAIRFLALLDPSLGGKSTNDPALIAAERHLARIQSRVAKALLTQADIHEIKWQLDREWYLEHGISLP